MISTKMYESKRIIVRPLTTEDVDSEKYKSWFYDQEVTRHNSHGLFPYTENQQKDFKERIKAGNEIIWAVLAKIKYLKEKSFAFDPIPILEFIHIGNISLQNINWINRSAEFAIVIGDKESWGKGYGTEAANFLFEHGFNKLNLNRIWTGTSSTNIGMKKIAEKLGMKKEGVFKNALYLEGRYVDVFEYGILKSDWNQDRVFEDNGVYFRPEDFPEKQIKQSLIDRISEIRVQNNKNWMNILKLAQEKAPEETKKIMKEISDHDKKITALTEELAK